MRVRLTLAAALAAAVVPVAAVGPVAPTQAAPTATASQTLHIRVRAAIKQLPLVKPSHAGSYDRDKQFGDWITQHGECDTRAVVLIDESLKPVTRNDYCTVSKGRWYSYYDAK